MTWIGIFMIIVAGLLAFKVTAFFFRILLIGVVLLGLFLVLSPLLGTA
jgi:hypothetical protein